MVLQLNDDDVDVSTRWTKKWRPLKDVIKMPYEWRNIMTFVLCEQHLNVCSFENFPVSPRSDYESNSIYCSLI